MSVPPGALIVLSDGILACHQSITGASEEHNSKTVELFPAHIDMLYLSSKDMISYAALDLIAALKNPSPATPLSIGDQKLWRSHSSLTSLQTLFHLRSYQPTQHLQGWETSILIKNLQG